ncbi:hypothetical protein V8E53_000754 [Lactarius tabidus]
MYNFSLPPNDPESKDEEEDELHEENLAPVTAPAPTPAHVLAPTPHPHAPRPRAPMSVDDTADDAMAVDMVLPVTERDVGTAFAVPVSAASHIVGTSSGTPETATPTIQGHSSTIVGSSSATVCSSAVPTSSSSAAADTLFAEGVTDSKFNARPSDEELAESELSVEEMIQRAPLFCTQLIAMLHELNSWSSLMEHHTNARKSKEG